MTFLPKSRLIELLVWLHNLSLVWFREMNNRLPVPTEFGPCALYFSVFTNSKFERVALQI